MPKSGRTYRLSEDELERLAELVAKEIIAPVIEQIQSMADVSLRKAAIISALENDTLVPMVEAAAVLGLSRDVCERLRSENRLRPVVTNITRNARMFVTVGHLRNLVRSLPPAKAPNKQRLQKRVARRKQSKRNSTTDG